MLNPLQQRWNNPRQLEPLMRDQAPTGSTEGTEEQTKQQTIPIQDVGMQVDTQHPRGYEIEQLAGWWRPRTDVYEMPQEKKIVVEFELPGVDMDHIVLTASDTQVTVASSKEMSNKERLGRYFQQERHFGHFYRKVVLPAYVDTSKSPEAFFDHGVLQIIFPTKQIQEPEGERVPISVLPKKESLQ